jgi:hypothetical protein
VQPRGDVGEPAIQTLDHGLGDQVVLGAEMVGDRGEVGTGFLGDHPGGDALGWQALQQAEGCLQQVGAVAALRTQRDSFPQVVGPALNETIRSFRLRL